MTTARGVLGTVDPLREGRCRPRAAPVGAGPVTGVSFTTHD